MKKRGARSKVEERIKSKRRATERGYLLIRRKLSRFFLADWLFDFFAEGA